MKNRFKTVIEEFNIFSNSVFYFRDKPASEGGSRYPRTSSLRHILEIGCGAQAPRVRGGLQDSFPTNHPEPPDRPTLTFLSPYSLRDVP